MTRPQIKAASPANTTIKLNRAERATKWTALMAVLFVMLFPLLPEKMQRGFNHWVIGMVETGDPFHSSRGTLSNEPWDSAYCFCEADEAADPADCISRMLLCVWPGSMEEWTRSVALCPDDPDCDDPPEPAMMDLNSLQIAR